MGSTSPVALILGQGANVGKSVAGAFAKKGYKIALVARSLKEENSTASELHIKGDLADPESVTAIFGKVKTKFGPPSVVVYNGRWCLVSYALCSADWCAAASAWTRIDKSNPFALPLEDFNRDFAINTTSAFMAAKHAALAFDELPASAARTFIYTGNCTNVMPMGALFHSGMGKSAAAHMIQIAAEAYKDKGFKFYYADERKPDGTPMYGAINGDAHADYYMELAEEAAQGPWAQTFVKGVGYTKFY
ncbi:hypothetical protein PG994_013759 [Apiospora phragmitis]|uniref:Uncharacterized protein n=1 Tax=Apiospora phragmitis TaxID=2905665 RepID=A0ABR1T2D0_9PEZI